MIRRVIFKPEAEADLADAYGWYEQRDAGLGAEFIRCVESCVNGIQRHPEITERHADGPPRHVCMLGLQRLLEFTEWGLAHDLHGAIERAVRQITVAVWPR